MEKLFKGLFYFALIFAVIFWPLVLQSFDGLMILVFWWMLLLIIGTYIDTNSKVKAKVKAIFQSYNETK